MVARAFEDRAAISGLHQFRHLYQAAARWNAGSRCDRRWFRWRIGAARRGGNCAFRRGRGCGRRRWLAARRGRQCGFNRSGYNRRRRRGRRCCHVRQHRWQYGISRWRQQFWISCPRHTRRDWRRRRHSYIGNRRASVDQRRDAWQPSERGRVIDQRRRRNRRCRHKRQRWCWGRNILWRHRAIWWRRRHRKSFPRVHSVRRHSRNFRRRRRQRHGYLQFLQLFRRQRRRRRRSVHKRSSGCGRQWRYRGRRRRWRWRICQWQQFRRRRHRRAR